MCRSSGTTSLRQVAMVFCCVLVLRCTHLSISHCMQVGDVARAADFTFDSQAVRWLDPPVQLHHGDILSSTCLYSSEERTQPTLGGLASSDEMCLVFLIVTPGNCSALPSVLHLVHTHFDVTPQCVARSNTRQCVHATLMSAACP
jgi:Copper type II ascorbate-dependent monooxygenase, C-terminal domain